MYNKQQMVYEFRQLTKIKFRKGILLKLQRDLLIELLTFLHYVIENGSSVCGEREREREPCL